MELGKRIQMKRKAMGLSLEELASKVGCSKGLIGQWECGILPAKMNKGAIARAKKILKVRSRARIAVTKPAKVSARNKVGRPRLQPVDKMFRTLVDIQTRMRRIEYGINALKAKKDPVAIESLVEGPVAQEVSLG